MEQKCIYNKPMLDLMRLSNFPFVSGVDVVKKLEENENLWEAILVAFPDDIEDVVDTDEDDGVLLKSFSITTTKDNTAALYTLLSQFDPSVIAIQSKDEFSNVVLVEWNICNCCAK